MRGVAVGKEEGEEEEGKKGAEERRGRGTGAELHRGDTSSPASREALGEPVLYLYWDVRWGKPPLPSECDPHSLRNTCRACHCRVLVVIWHMAQKVIIIRDQRQNSNTMLALSA